MLLHGVWATVIGLVTALSFVPGGVADVDKTACATSNPGIACTFFCFSGDDIFITGVGTVDLFAETSCGGITVTCENDGMNHCQDSDGPTTSEDTGICSIEAGEGAVVCGVIL